jgi:hypothetical protein
VPYPQYGAITQTLTDLRKSRYQSLTIRLQRPFHKGCSLLATYAYVRSKTQWYFDAQDQYDGKLTWFDFSSTQSGSSGAPQAAADPKHNISLAATFEIPVGRGRAIGKEMPSVLDAILGGWMITGMYRYNAGALLVFYNQLEASGEPAFLKNQGAQDKWFDTSVFKAADVNKRRTNPWTYDGLTGPRFSDLTLGLSKRIKLNERFKLELRLDAFNALNGMNWAPQNQLAALTDFGSNMGILNTQMWGYAGRQLQYSARIEF